MELEVIKQIIKDLIGSQTITLNEALVAERYYRNDNDILCKKIETDEVGNPLRNADNRIPNNFHGLLVNQKASYLFTAPPLFDVGKEQANNQITEALGDNFPKVCKDLCINAANAGIGWVHYWINGDGQFEYAVVDSKQIVPIYSTQLNKKLLGIMRVYDQRGGDGLLYDVYEYWTDTECQTYRKAKNTTVDDGLEVYHMFIDIDTNANSPILAHDFERPPFIPFPNNNLSRNDLRDIKGHIDSYDKVYSGFVNDLEDIQEIIFVLSGYSGTELNGFLSDIKKFKAIKLDEYGEGSSGVNALTIDIPIEARKELLDITRKAIFEKGQGVDPQPEQFGNASGVALKFMYSLLELKAGLLETEFKVGFGELIRAICKHHKLECKSVIQTWTRTAITNDTEIAEICKNSVGTISQRTILANHPFVEDVQAEMDDLEEEQQKQADNYGAFPLEQQGDQVNTDETD